MNWLIVQNKVIYNKARFAAQGYVQQWLDPTEEFMAFLSYLAS